MSVKSLKARKDDLSSPKKQLEILDNGMFEDGDLPRFKDKIEYVVIDQPPDEIKKIHNEDKLEIKNSKIGSNCRITCC